MSALISNSPVPPNTIFAYGTLMEGQPQHALLREGGICTVMAASIAGELVDLGDYPALRLDPYITTRVHGQLIELDRVDTILERLDDYEGPEFRRELINVTVEGGRLQRAWTYVLAGEAGREKVIASGRWASKAAGA